MVSALALVSFTSQLAPELYTHVCTRAALDQHCLGRKEKEKDTQVGDQIGSLCM